MVLLLTFLSCEIFALLWGYAEWIGHYLTKFRDNILVQTSRVKQPACLTIKKGPKIGPKKVGNWVTSQKSKNLIYSVAEAWN
jgi:hypothetical protein